MKIINKLTLKNIKLNKQRSIVTIVGIMLSCALITALLSLVVSFQDTLMEESLNSYGNRHVTFEDVPSSELSKIKNHKEVKSYYMTANSTIKLDTKYDELAGLVGIDKKGLSDLENLLDSGKVPSNENEIVIDSYYAERFNVKLGDEITLEIGKRYLDGEELNDNNSMTYDENNNLLESFDVIETKTYKVVGTTGYYTFLKTMYNYSLFTYQSEFNDYTDIHVLYENPKNYSEITNSINDMENNDDMGKYTFSTNSEYLRWAGYSVDDSTREFIYLFALVIALIIMGTSIFCIKNSFAISTTEKTKMYGMIASVGATPKQIKRSVLSEGFYLGIIGIPLGIIGGLITTFILINVVNYLLPTLEDWEFIYSVSLLSIIISIILSSVTIYFSALGSSRKASKITEIEAIKNQNEIKIKKKKIKVPKIISKVFKIGGVFAYKNVERNKSKFRTITISLAVSVTIFIALSYFIQLGMDTTKEYYKSATYDLGITPTTTGEPYANQAILNAYDDILKLGKPNQYSIAEYSIFDIDKKYMNERLIIETIDEEPIYTVQLLAMGDKEYKRILKENNLNYEEVYNKGLIINNKIEIVNTEGENEWIKLFKDNVNNIEVKKIDSNNITNIDLINIEKLPVGSDSFLYSAEPVILVSNEFLNSIDTNIHVGSLYLTTDNIREYHDKIIEYDNISEMTFWVNNLEEIVEMQENMILLIGIFLYGFIGVIILISLTNIFNTITTNMKLRSKEFAVLKSIGMSDKEFKNMIRLESIFYGTKSLLYGLIFGSLLAYLMYYLLMKYDILAGAELGYNFILPWKYMLIAIIFVFLIIYLIMRISLLKINKQNTIETIKNENI